MVTIPGDKYRCTLCLQEIIVVKEGKNIPVCCGRPMEKIDEGYLGETTGD
jgi:desulfoferrodoxin-like iron-binding protein